MLQAIHIYKPCTNCRSSQFDLTEQTKEPCVRMFELELALKSKRVATSKTIKQTDNQELLTMYDMHV